MKLLIIIMLCLSVAGLIWALHISDQAHVEFMQECMDDGKKKYECTAMLRAGENHNTTVAVPVVMR